jgi:hypothetical protein
MEHIDRRSFLTVAGTFAASTLTGGAVVEILRPKSAWAAQQVAKVTHPASARVLDRLRGSRLPVRHWREASTSSKWGLRC